jgi:hypothetical protein
LQAILSNGVATVRQTLRRMFSALAAERAKKRRKLVLRLVTSVTRMTLAGWLLRAHRRPRPAALRQDYFFILDFPHSRTENFCLCVPRRHKT